MASIIFSSLTSSAPDSIITTEVPVAATIRSSLDLPSSCSTGLITISSSTRPTFTPAMGPWKGISEMDKAVEAPNIPKMPGSFSPS